MTNYLLWFIEASAAVLPVLATALLLMLLVRRHRLRRGAQLPALSPRRILLRLALLGDLLVTLMLTLVARPVLVSVQLFPLASWIEAWNCWEAPLFTQIFLNVAVFLPFGALLALNFTAMHRLPRIAGLSFGFSLCIECLQLLLRRGVFDIDDLLGNTVGGLLGGALVCLVRRLRAGRGKSAATAALPLLSAALGIALFFGVYAAQPYGNLRIAPIYPISMRAVSLTAAPLPTEAPTEAAIYRTVRKTEADARAVFARVRAALSLPDACGSVTVYPDAIDWHFPAAGLSLSYTLDGGSWYLHHAPGGSCPAPDITAPQALAAWLTDFALPATDAFIYLRDDGMWSVAPKEARQLPAAPRIYFTPFPDGAWTLDVRTTDYRAEASVPILTPAEALAAVQAGRFLHMGAPFRQLTLTDLFLTYYADSKGFYQPVWQFTAAFDGTERALPIPARK